MQFCKEYNAATQDKAGMIIPVEITVYEDRSFTFILKTPPASGERPLLVLRLRMAGPPVWQAAALPACQRCCCRCRGDSRPGRLCGSPPAASRHRISG